MNSVHQYSNKVVYGYYKKRSHNKNWSKYLNYNLKHKKDNICFLVLKEPMSRVYLDWKYKHRKNLKSRNSRYSSQKEIIINYSKIFLLISMASIKLCSDKMLPFAGYKVPIKKMRLFLVYQKVCIKITYQKSIR